MQMHQFTVHVLLSMHVQDDCVPKNCSFSVLASVMAAVTVWQTDSPSLDEFVVIIRRRTELAVYTA